MKRMWRTTKLFVLFMTHAAGYKRYRGYPVTLEEVMKADKETIEKFKKGDANLNEYNQISWNQKAAALSDPVICYILDAFLLIYCIIFTALYFREKFSMSLITQRENKNTQEGEGVGGTYEAVGTRDTEGAAAVPSNPESGAVRRQRTQAADDNYAALQHRTSDTYSQIQNKRKKKRAQADKSQVYESLQQPSTDTYNSLEMRPLPPRDPPN